MDVSVNYILFEPSLPPVPSEGGNFMSATNRLLTCHWGFPMPDVLGLEPPELMRWCDPISVEDGFLGRKCAASGIWFPGRMLVEVNGKVYGIPFAPQHQRDTLPQMEWGIEDAGD